MAVSPIQVSTPYRTQGEAGPWVHSLTDPATAGSKLIAFVGNYPSGLDEITDDQGNTWHLDYSYGDGGNNYIEVWYADNVAAGTQDIEFFPTITSDVFISAVIHEVAGVAAGDSPAGYTGQSSAAFTTNTVSTSGSVSAGAYVGTAIIADEGLTNMGFATPEDFTLLDREQNSNLFTGYQAAFLIADSAGVVSAAHGVGANTPTDAIIVAWPEATSSGNTASPGAGSVEISGQAPTVQRTDNRAASPGTGTVAVSGLQPAAVVSDNRSAQPDAGTLVLQGHQPQAQTTDHRTTSPGAGAMVLTGHAPTLQQSAHHVVQPGTGSLTINGQAPTVQAGEGHITQPDAGAVVLAGQAPTVARSDHHTAQPPAGAMTWSGHAPTIISSESASPGAGEVVISGHAPTATASANVLAEPGPGEIVITGYAPQVVAAVSVQPGSGGLVITGQPPTVRVRPIQPPKPAVNLLDPKYLGKKHRNVRFKPAEQQEPAPVVTAPTQSVPPQKAKPKASALLQSLLKRVEMTQPSAARPSEAKPPAAPAASREQPLQPAPVAPPAPAPYASDLDPFYEPDASDALADIEARMQAQVQALQHQLAAVKDELQQLKKQPYQSDLDPFYESEPLQQLAVDLRERRQRENRRRAKLMVRQLLD